MSWLEPLVAVGGPADGKVLDRWGSGQAVIWDDSNGLDHGPGEIYTRRKFFIGPTPPEEGPIFVMCVLLWNGLRIGESAAGDRLVAELVHSVVRRVGMRAEVIAAAAGRSWMT